MKQETRHVEKKKDRRRPILLVVGGVIGVVLLWLVTSVVLFMAADDGLSQYSGAKQRAAQSALDIAESRYDNKLRWMHHFRVEDVRPTTAEEKTQVCHNPAYITEDVNDPAYYTVVLSQQQLFSFGNTTETQIGCHSDKFLYN